MNGAEFAATDTIAMLEAFAQAIDRCIYAQIRLESTAGLDLPLGFCLSRLRQMAAATAVQPPKTVSKERLNYVVLFMRSLAIY